MKHNVLTHELPLPHYAHLNSVPFHQHFSVLNQIEVLLWLALNAKVLVVDEAVNFETIRQRLQQSSGIVVLNLEFTENQ